MTMPESPYFYHNMARVSVDDAIDHDREEFHSRSVPFILKIKCVF